MDTKLKGDIAEQAAILHALKFGWGVLKPVGDRLPYDLVFDVGGTLVKVQVFINYGSEIHLVEADKRQRKPRSAEYRNAWDLISHYCINQMNLFPTAPLKTSSRTESQDLKETRSRCREDAWSEIDSTLPCTLTFES
jgi:hypothetical protein